MSIRLGFLKTTYASSSGCGGGGGGQVVAYEFFLPSIVATLTHLVRGRRDAVFLIV